MDLTRLSFRKKAPLVVDVDEMNCLAELTVVLKSNQGAGNGCKSLPACFSLVLSFARAKESTENISLIHFLYIIKKGSWLSFHPGLFHFIF